MGSETATIRVPRETRDRLAERAEQRGMSVPSLITEFSRRAARTEALRSERQATRAEAADADALAEEQLWGARARRWPRSCDQGSRRKRE